MSSAIIAPRLPVRSHHRFGLLAAAAIAVVTTTSEAGIMDLAVWTFESAAASIAGPHYAEGGVYAGQAQLFAQHQDPAVNYTTPLGNGSQKSLAANRWRAGDFVQFSASTLGFESVELSWDWTRSATAAESFAVQYSTDGVQFSTFVNEMFITPITWSATTYNPDSTVGPILLPGDAANQSEVHFRLMALSDSAGVSGTVRFDNIRISAMTIPAPGAALLLAGAGLPGRRRRRTQA